MILGMPARRISQIADPGFDLSAYTGDGVFPRTFSTLNAANGGIALFGQSAGSGTILVNKPTGGDERSKPADGQTSPNSLATSFYSISGSGFSGLAVSTPGTNTNSVSYFAYFASVNPDWMTITEYVGTGSARSVAHGMTSTPEVVLVVREGASRIPMQIKGITANSLFFGATASQSFTNFWDSQIVDATNVYLLTDNDVNASGQNYRLICIGGEICQQRTYTGNGNVVGPNINFGWQPDVVLIKRRNGSDPWYAIDSARNPGLAQPQQRTALGALLSATANYISPNSTGFQLTTTDAAMNANNTPYVAIGFRRKP